MTAASDEAKRLVDELNWAAHYKDERNPGTKERREAANRNLLQYIATLEAKAPPYYGDIRLGAKVKKLSGYKFPGTVRAAFHTSAGNIRFVVEFQDDSGLLHIFNGDQLQLRDEL